MGLTSSTDSSSAYVTLGILRSVLGFDLQTNGKITPFEIPPIKSRSLNDNLAINLSQEKISTEFSKKLQNDIEKQYNWWLELGKSKKFDSSDSVLSDYSAAAIIQQIIKEHSRKSSKTVETEVSQSKVEKETETLLSSSKEPWFISQWYQSIDGKRYGVTIDTNNTNVMAFLENYSVQSSYGLDDESVSELTFSMKSGEELVLRFNKRDPKTLEVLTEAMMESTGNRPISGNKIEAKQIYSFVFLDKRGHKICCSIDMNNPRVLKKLKIMEQWALELADPCDLFDIKMETSQGSTTTFQLDLKNTTTIKNLRALKEESLTGKCAKLVNPIRKKEKVQELLISDLVAPNIKETQTMTVELFSPYTGPFMAVFDVTDEDLIEKLQKFDEEFRGSFYQYLVTIETTSKKTYEIKLDMANPRIVYELIMMSRKHSIEVVSFDPKILLNNLITILMPEDDVFLTFDTSRSVVYGGLFDVSNRERKGVELTIPCKGDLVHLYLDVTNPKTISKIRSFALATIAVNTVRKLSLITLIFLNTPTGFKPISLDLADKKNVVAICKVIRNNPIGRYPTHMEIMDDTGQFVTVSLDLNNPNIVECLISISKAAWFVNINAIQCPYLAVCLPAEERHRTIKVRLKPVIIDEMAKMLDKYCPDYTLLEIFDARRKCSIIYIDPTMPNLINKMASITNAVLVLPPISDNAVTIFDPASNAFVDIDLSLPESRRVLLQLENEYQSNKPLAVIKYYTFDKEMYTFVNVDDRFMKQMQTICSNMGRHIRLKPSVQEEYVLKITDYSGTSISLPMNLANVHILRELEKLTNSDDSNINTRDAYGYPIKVKIDASSQMVIRKLITMNEEISKNFSVK